MDAKSKWTRRKEARPAEIVDAAIDLFVEKGFAGTTLTDVAKRAGVVKGTLYIYFETKEDLFRAAARQAMTANLDAIEQGAMAFTGAFADFVPMLLQRAAAGMGDSRIPAIVRMVLSESRSFPDLARIWHDEVVARILALLVRLISEAQSRGEVRPGDPKLMALSIVGPMVMGVLYREVLGAESLYAPDLDALAAQHSEIVMDGLSPAMPRNLNDRKPARDR